MVEEVADWAVVGRTDISSAQMLLSLRYWRHVNQQMPVRSGAAWVVWQKGMSELLSVPCLRWLV